MRYNAIQRCEYVNGNDIGVSLYIQGCSIHCKGCFNPETWDFEGGHEFDIYAKDYFYFRPHQRDGQAAGQQESGRCSL